jgi:NADH:ubiquinone oxidoreductase subunit F (NADH-binding)
VTIVHRILPAQPYESLEDYLRDGGGRGLDLSRRVEPVEVIDALQRAGLRGRGGAWFPTAEKWRTVIENASAALSTTVVVNAAEGEPGTFKDRMILRANPYAVLEGAAIAARVTGAQRIVVAIKASFEQERRRLAAAIDEMRRAGLFDGCRVEIVTGPDEYLFGEETALLEVLEGREPFPRIAPPFRRGVVDVVLGDADVGTSSGLSAHVEMAGPDDSVLAPPALVDNVETMANVPGIVALGPDAFRSLGTPESPGTVVCTVTGAVGRAGVAEIALGTTLRDAIDEIGGGLADGVEVALVMNGVSGAPLGADQLDTPLTLEAMTAAGSALGTASFRVVGTQTDVPAVAAGVARFLAVESCGQCTPCKQDGLALADALDRLCAAGAVGEDLDLVRQKLTTVADGARCALARQQQAVVGALVGRYEGAFAARVEAEAPLVGFLVAELRSIEGDHAVDADRAGKQPDWSHDPVWGGSSPVDRHTDHRAAAS